VRLEGKQRSLKKREKQISKKTKTNMQKNSVKDINRER
jgi:hypothetical protein